MQNKIIDAKAQFPAAPSTTMLAQTNLPDDWTTDNGPVVDEVPQATSATPAIITIRGDENGVVIEKTRADASPDSSAPRAEARPPKDALEIEKVMSGMGRDPATGAVVTPAAGPQPAALRTGASL
jgi:hypothetical protein